MTLKLDQSIIKIVLAGIKKVSANPLPNIFYKVGIEEIINIQPNGAKAKPYQVKQVRKLIIRYKLGGLDDV